MVTVPVIGASLTQRETIAVLAACSLTLLALTLAMFAFSRRWQDPDKGLLSDSVHLMEGNHRGNNGHIVDHIKLSAIVGMCFYLFPCLFYTWGVLLPNYQCFNKIYVSLVLLSKCYTAHSV